MKTILLTSLLSALSLVALADPKSDLKAAAAKLAEASSYTWTAKTEMANSQAPAATLTGKAEKGGFAVITSERDGNTTMAVRKGEKGVVKVEGEWKTAEDLRGGGGGGGGGGWRGGMLLRTQMPAEDAPKMLERVKELKDMDGYVGGELTEAGAKELLAFRGRPGGNAPEPKNAKGFAKFWLKDGAIAKMEVKVSGTISMQNEDRDVSRTTTYEFKDVGSTKVEVPADAKSKIGS
jgi:hypothetical protein